MTPEQIAAKRSRPVLTHENQAEFIAKRLDLKPVEKPILAPEVKPETTETKVEPTSVAPTETKSEVKTETKPEVKTEDNPIQARISEVVHQRNEARQKAEAEAKAREALEKELAELRAKTTPASTKPDRAQFPDPYQYAEALSQWSAQEAVKSFETEQAKRAQEQARAKMVSDWQARQSAFKAVTPDYEGVVAASDVAVSDDLRDAILESDVGPQLLYHLALHPEEGKRIAALNARSALRELGKLEASLAKSEVKTETKPAPLASVSKAPPPITPLKGDTSTGVLPLTADGEFRGTPREWREARRKGLIK